MMHHFALSIYEKIDAEWDIKFREKGFKCGIENVWFEEWPIEGSSRIFNGRKTNNIKYPWMAQIFWYMPEDLNIKEYKNIAIAKNLQYTDPYKDQKIRAMNGAISLCLS